MGLLLTLSEGEGFTVTAPDGKKIIVELIMDKYCGNRIKITAPNDWRISRDTKNTRANTPHDPNPTNAPELKVKPGDCPKCKCRTVRVLRASARAQCCECRHKWEIVVPRV